MRIIKVFLLTLCISGIFSGCEKVKLAIPVADFSMADVGKRGEAIIFENSSKNASSYNWNFGDGNSSSEVNPKHVYKTGGEYMVTLTATNETGIKTTVKSLFIKDFTVMTYNVALSGGAIPQVIEIAKANGHKNYLTDRMSEILSVIRKVDPDILGLQETMLWDSFDPHYYKTIANALDMEYYYYPENAECVWNGICFIQNIR